MRGEQESRENGIGVRAHDLNDLIPIAVVIAAGCEECAEKMVRRALQEGASPRLVRRTLAVVAQLRANECLTKAVGKEVVARMEKPIEAGRRALQQAAGASEGCCCG
jgi:hypothetical protein